MSAKLQRMLDRAKARRAKETAADAILIDCERPEDVPRRVDLLIAAGNLTEADRPRCAFWPFDWKGTPDERVLIMIRNTTPEEKRRGEAEAAARNRAALMADPILAAYYRKNGWA